MRRCRHRHRGACPVLGPTPRRFRQIGQNRVGHAHGRITSSVMATYGRFPRYRVRPRWHRVRGTGHSRAGVALGGVGSQRHWIRRSHSLRTLSAAELTWLGGPARHFRRCARSIRTCCWSQHPFTGLRIQPPPATPASRARNLAGHNSPAGVSCGVRHEYRSGTCTRERAAAVAINRAISAISGRSTRSLDKRAQYVVHRRVASRIFYALQRTSRLQQSLHHSRELALRMTLLHQAVVQRIHKRRRIIRGVANIHRMPARNQQLH